MNNNINIAKILKNCPRGTKLYSTIFGEVEFLGLCEGEEYAITIKRNFSIAEITKDGRYLSGFDGECTLFPSKDQRDWSKFTAPWYKKERFNPKTLKPFDKVLVKTCETGIWYADMVSVPATDEENEIPILIGEYDFDSVIQVIPYNENTKHLLGTTDEAPEYYRYWED